LKKETKQLTADNIALDGLPFTRTYIIKNICSCSVILTSTCFIGFIKDMENDHNTILQVGKVVNAGEGGVADEGWDRL
jgi:hypothetical protein